MAGLPELPRAALASLATASSSLAEAFHEDPYFVYALPDPARRRRILPVLFAGLLRYGSARGRTYLAAGGAGAAIWLGPERLALTAGSQLRAGLWRLPLLARPPELLRLLVVARRIEGLHRRVLGGRHYYLLALGVRPACQGRGVGTSLLLPVLGEADAGGLPCYLETTREGNLAFYARLGFLLAGEEEGPAGLRIWAMVRRPGQ